MSYSRYELGDTPTPDERELRQPKLEHAPGKINGPGWFQLDFLPWLMKWAGIAAFLLVAGLLVKGCA